MEDFPHLSVGTVDDENVDNFNLFISNLKDKVNNIKLDNKDDTTVIQNINSLIDNLKKKGEIVSENYITDIGEIVDTLSKDTSKTLKQIQTSLSNQLNSTNSSSISNNEEGGWISFNKISKFVTEIINIEKPEENNESKEIKKLDKFSIRKQQLELDQHTFLKDDLDLINPNDTGLKNFEEFLQAKDEDEYHEKVMECLQTNDNVKSMFFKLVPNQVSPTSFWDRYFYAIYKLEFKEKKLESILKLSLEETEDNFEWDDNSSEDEAEDKDEKSTKIENSIEKENVHNEVDVNEEDEVKEAEGEGNTNEGFEVIDELQGVKPKVEGEKTEANEKQKEKEDEDGSDKDDGWGQWE